MASPESGTTEVKLHQSPKGSSTTSTAPAEIHEDLEREKPTLQLVIRGFKAERSRGASGKRPPVKAAHAGASAQASPLHRPLSPPYTCSGGHTCEAYSPVKGSPHQTLLGRERQEEAVSQQIFSRDGPDAAAGPGVCTAALHLSPQRVTAVIAVTVVTRCSAFEQMP